MRCSRPIWMTCLEREVNSAHTLGMKENETSRGQFLVESIPCMGLNMWSTPCMGLYIWSVPE